MDACRVSREGEITMSTATTVAGLFRTAIHMTTQQFRVFARGLRDWETPDFNNLGTLPRVNP